MSSEAPRHRFSISTIGARLTAWGAGITLVVCLLVCGALYGGVWYALNREVDSFLEGEVREFLGTVEQEQFNYARAQELIRSHLGNRSRVDLAFRILDANGNPLLTSHENDLFPHNYARPDLADLPHSRFTFASVTVSGRKHPVRLCTLPVQTADGRRLIAEACYALDQVSASLSLIRMVAFVALSMAVGMSLLGGRIVARRSLGPLHRMIQTARHISADRIADRLPRSHTGDEFDALAETLNSLLDRIDQYVRRMQQFTADASHELRSPLAALQGSAEVALARDRSAEELRGVIESSVEHYRRLRKISEDLLLLARIDSGEEVPAHKALRLNDLIDDVVDLYEPTAAQAGLQVVISSPEPVHVVGDGGRIRQVIANLIDNAIKYTAAPGRISVSLTSQNGCAVIEIHDTGIGIPAEDLSHVFERFHRVDRARTAGHFSGAGLGLAICRSIVTAHGGQIALSSTPGEGTLVRIELPRAIRTLEREGKDDRQSHRC